jgi:Spy/CpxP family protein refolding chaperone
LTRIATFLLALAVAAGAAAQPPRPSVMGPGPEPRRDLWQVLTPEQRDQLWRSLSAEQRADVWRGLEPQERREVRNRIGAPESDGDGRIFGPAPYAEGGDGSGKQMMTPEERQRMREQIREAHRLRRERLEQERRSRMPLR